MGEGDGEDAKRVVRLKRTVIRIERAFRKHVVVSLENNLFHCDNLVLFDHSENNPYFDNLDYTLVPVHDCGCDDDRQECGENNCDCSRRLGVQSRDYIPDASNDGQMTWRSHRRLDHDLYEDVQEHDARPAHFGLCECLQE